MRIRPADDALSPTDPELLALMREHEALAREYGRVQRRCTTWRRDTDARIDALEADLLRARATALAKDTLIASLQERVDALLRAAAPGPTPAPRRRVLCVGGRSRQLPVYRDLVERQGARFSHVGGGADDSPDHLAAALADADVVILQPGYVCRGACDQVAHHCEKTGKRCVWLDKPCALGFERSLAAATSSSMNLNAG